MSESKKSGEFILKNLQIFNEAYSFFSLSINKKIEQSMDKCIEYFANKNNWEGKFQFSEGEDWLRPKGWKENYGNEAKFSINCTESEEDDNLWLSCFCQNSINNVEAGFFFEKKFSKGKKKNNLINSLSEEQYDFLQKIGFKKFDDQFFLPIKLSNEALAKSWLKEDPFTPNDECFAPLNDALAKLKQSVPIFEAIMESALASQNS